MEIEKFIGFRFDTIKTILDDTGIKYNLIEVWDTKKTKVGDELRIIKVDNSDDLKIYVSYF
jgi:hypothetical protein